MKTPDRTTAAAFSSYALGQIVADSAELRWSGLFVRRVRLPRIVDRYLVPATAEPLISCVLAGRAEMEERELTGPWIPRPLQRGDIFVTRSSTPYELRSHSRPGEEIETVLIHVAIDSFCPAVQTVHGARCDNVEVVDFFGRDEALAHLCYLCTDLLAQRAPSDDTRVLALTQLVAAWIAEKYMTTTDEQPDFRGGLPVHQLRKVEDFVREHLADDISTEQLAELVELSPFHFSRVFKQTTGVTPLHFITRERITLAQQLIRETTRSLLDISLEVGYTSPSHFAQVFRRIAGVTPTEFRRVL